MLKEKFKWSSPSIFLIDGSSYIYRAFYAYRNLTRSDGFPTNVIFIVLKLALKILREEEPDYLGFFVDGKGPTFRNKIYSEYKANRLKMPEPLSVQIPPLLEGLKLLGISSWITEGVEADDCIASLTKRFKEQYPIVIVGSDKDLFQLLDRNVVIWDPGGKESKIITHSDFKEKWGFSPNRWPDFQALVGDSSDNIPGIPGIGPKTAQKILQKFSSLELLEENFLSLTKREQQKIKGNFNNLYLYRELTFLKTDACLDIELKDLKVEKINHIKLKKFCEKYEFFSFLKELNLENKTSIVPKGLPIFSRDNNLKENTNEFKIKRVEEKDLILSLPSQLGLFLEKGRVFLSNDKEEFEILFDLSELFPLLQKKVVFCPQLKPILKRFPNILELSIQWYDLSLCAYLLNPEQRDYSFSRLKKSLEQDRGISIQGKALAVLEVGRHLLAQIQAVELEDLLVKLEQPLSAVLVEMEKRGILIDKQKFNKFLNLVQQELDSLTTKIYVLAGKEFNIRSTQQLSAVLFQDLKLKGKKKTASGFFSTSEAALEKLRQAHPIVELVLKYKRLEKLRSTYLKPLPQKVDINGRLHTTFNQLATATGRLSSSNPNLQNIPIRGEYGPKVRECFIAPNGYKLISADYSQIELRILAHLSEDPVLLEAFNRDEDIHTATACLIFSKSKEQITPDDRRKAKTINFGLLYGMGPQKLARELGFSLKEAKQFITVYFEKLSRVKEFYQKVENFAKTHGFVSTVFGRRRLLPHINSRNEHLVAQAKRMAINTVVQGSAADIIKKAMLLVEKDALLYKLNARQILQIHDELLLEVPENVAFEAGKRVKELMEQVYPLKVPLKVDLGIGPNWKEAH
ncbi:DNA polymerase I [Desulfonauticus submarinus]|uniref:DNA polymerase I n=1 Tax=Desulfonauticus submarinus TaxID=206665 RepID=A0A1H0ELX0_9BACT|nr:DNA polymerase I [Desulfonauticus submarinus]SDN83418.1 DNA polymerase I [Desulfonauticus submarinus]